MRKIIPCLFVFVAAAGFSAKPQTKAEEYNLKAAFLYNFTRYIEWDGYTSNSEFVIGIVGTSDIQEALKDIADSKSVDGKKIIIRKFNSPDEIGNCHILFISRNTPYTLTELFVNIPDKGTLVVSEKENFAEQGAAINFIIVNESLKFEMNINTLNSAGLKVSSQLLKLAVLVK